MVWRLHKTFALSMAYFRGISGDFRVLGWMLKEQKNNLTVHHLFGYSRR
jgi:hypothetical protein